MNELDERWAASREHINEACRLHGDADVAVQVADWLEYNELGLAFDVLVERADQDDASRPVWETLSKAADSMSLGPDDQTHGGSVATVLERLAGTADQP